MYASAMVAFYVLLLVGIALLSAACGEDNGNNDTVLTGASGVLIFGIIAWVVYRYIKKSGGKQ